MVEQQICYHYMVSNKVRVMSHNHTLMVNVINHFLCSALAMYQDQVLINPGDYVVLESTLNYLV